MKRAVIFAHYDKDKIVDDYVIYYLKALKEISDEIIFVSCNEIHDKSRLEGLVSKIIDERHDEYDFGSYKRGYLYLKDCLNNFDELVFVNDSCYGPFYSLKNVFDEMEKRDCDFWGITKNNYGYKQKIAHYFFKIPHVQSYFLVINKNIFTCDFFDKFICSVSHEYDKKDIIAKYEIGLTQMLLEKGFKFDVWVHGYGRINNITILKWRQIILKCKMPFLKCSLPRLINKNSTTVEGYQDIIKSVSDYPTELIENNVKRTKYIRNGRHTLPVPIKRCFFDAIAGLPFFVRKLIAIFISKCLPFIRD